LARRNIDKNIVTNILPPVTLSQDGSQQSPNTCKLITAHTIRQQ
jgi:hypothetical protein